MNPLLSALVAAGIITQDDADRINRQLDPDAARLWAEQQIAVAMQAGLSDQRARLVDLILARGRPLTDEEMAAFWYQEHDRLYGILQPALDDIAIDRAAAVAIRASGAEMWNAINQALLDWTHNYYTSPNPDFVGSVRSLDQTSREQVADAFGRWMRGELDDGGPGGLPALVRELETIDTFGPARSARIAATEVTRIFSEAEQVAADTDPELQYMTWNTVFDERVCPICGPLNGRSVRKGQSFSLGVRLPPAHVNCRCFVTASTAPVEDQLGTRNSR